MHSGGEKRMAADYDALYTFVIVTQLAIFAFTLPSSGISFPSNLARASSLARSRERLRKRMGDSDALLSAGDPTTSLW